MEKRNVKANTNWQVKSCVAPREEHLFYRAVRTKVGRRFTPLAASSKITSSNNVKFFFLATCEYFTDHPVMQFVSVEFNVLDGVIQETAVNLIGPEQVEFVLEF
jgi:hypothetical protein